MSFIINQLTIRNILNSCGTPGIEVETRINDRFTAVGSGPSAIKPGKREKKKSNMGIFVNTHPYDHVLKDIQNRHFRDQEDFDTCVGRLDKEHDLGSDLTLSLSISFCKACALARGKPLFEYISDISRSGTRMPYPMANIFSGGIHSLNKGTPFQQIMIIPRYASLVENLHAIIDIYSSIENKMRASGNLHSYSASSGLIVTNYSMDELFALTNAEIARLHRMDNVKLGIDAAAEHLHIPGGLYRYRDHETISADALYEEYRRLVSNNGVFYIEDPFDSGDDDSWKRLTMEHRGKGLIVGDDLFATSRENIEKGLANGILLKMNQVGSITGTIEAAHKASSMGLTLCVSHRSCETEDTTMCDLAVGLGAEYIKIGGPRRGDRVSKYNQLLRIELLRRSASNVMSCWSVD